MAVAPISFNYVAQKARQHTDMVQGRIDPQIRTKKQKRKSSISLLIYKTWQEE